MTFKTVFFLILAIAYFGKTVEAKYCTENRLRNQKSFLELAFQYEKVLQDILSMKLEEKGIQIESNSLNTKASFQFNPPSQELSILLSAELRTAKGSLLQLKNKVPLLFHEVIQRDAEGIPIKINCHIQRNTHKEPLLMLKNKTFDDFVVLALYDLDFLNTKFELI